MKRAILMAEDYVTEQEVVNIVRDGGKAFVVERYDPVSEEWIQESVNGLRIRPLDEQV